MIIEDRNRGSEGFPPNEWEARNSKKGILRPRFMGAADYAFYLRRHLVAERRRNDPTVGQPGDEGLSSGIPRLSFLLRRLEEDVQASYLSFLDEFVSEIHEGVGCLLSILRICQERQKGAGLFTYATCGRARQNLINRGTIDEFYCLLCLKACSKSSAAISKLSEHKTGLSTIASSITSSHIKSRIVALELLTTVSRSQDLGSSRVLEAMTTVRILFGESVRFKFLVSVLNSNVANSSGLETATLTLVNTLVDRCERLSDRVRIQGELEEAGLDVDLLEKQLRAKFGNSTHRVWSEIEKWRELKVDVQDVLQKHEENIKLKREVQLLRDALKRLRDERKDIFSIHKQLKGQWSNMEQRLQDITLKSRVMTATSSSSSDDDDQQRERVLSRSPDPRGGRHDSELDEILVGIPTIPAGSLLDTSGPLVKLSDSGISSHSASPDDSEQDWQYPDVAGRTARVRFDEAPRRSAPDLPSGTLILPPGQNKTRYADIMGVQNVPPPPPPPLPQRPSTPKSKKTPKKRSQSSNREKTKDRGKSFLPRSLQRSKTSKSTGNLTYTESGPNFQLAPSIPKYNGNNKLWNMDLQGSSQRSPPQIGSSIDGMIHREIAKAIRDRHALFDP